MTSRAFRRLTLGALVTLAGILASPTTARAGTIIDFGTAGCADTFCEPLEYLGGTLTLTSRGGDFTRKTLFDESGLGVSGRTTGEIDVDEFIDGAFSSAVTVDALRLVFIYNGPEFGDPSEIARVSVNGGALFGRLTADGENTATWSLGGTVTSCGATTFSGTGCFLIHNPFGTASVESISFTADSAGPGLSNDSDFSIGAIEVTQVPAIVRTVGPAVVPQVEPAFETAFAVIAAPEPSLLLLLGAGLTALRPRLQRRQSAR
jgi:hypothetical protein